MPRLQVTPVPAFEDNYLWLIHSPLNPAEVVAVDPGDGQAIERVLADQQLQLKAILVTHHHADHVGGVASLAEHYAVPVFGPAGESIPGHPAKLVQGDQVKLPELGLEFAVLDVPGHTAGHIAYVGHGAVFCGDTLFSGGCGRLFEGTAEQMWDSLLKLAALPPDTLVYCAHEYTLSNLRFALAVEPGNTDLQRYMSHCQGLREGGRPTLPSNIGQELRINPFLRAKLGNVKQAAEAHAGQPLHSDAAAFAELRNWKNQFRG